MRRTVRADRRDQRGSEEIERRRVAGVVGSGPRRRCFVGKATSTIAHLGILRIVARAERVGDGDEEEREERRRRTARVHWCNVPRRASSCRARRARRNERRCKLSRAWRLWFQAVGSETTCAECYPAQTNRPHTQASGFMRGVILTPTGPRAASRRRRSVNRRPQCQRSFTLPGVVEFDTVNA